MPVKVSNNDWVVTLAEFLRSQPGVNAVRVDAGSRKVAVATLGAVDPTDLEQKLAATIAAVEAQLAARATAQAPAGFTLRQEGGTTVLGRQMCENAEKLWLWREMKWPDIMPEKAGTVPEWKELAGLAAFCGGCGLAGFAAEHLVPGWPWLHRGFFLAGLVAGGMDAAKDSWGNLKTLKLDIHFLMLAVAIGAVCIGAWSEAVLLLFLFS
ncbi:MAG: cation-transporting P-type ATPase, partial [Opitutaceae bacterium]